MNIPPKQCHYCIYTIKRQGAYYILLLTLNVLVISAINVITITNYSFSVFMWMLNREDYKMQVGDYHQNHVDTTIASNVLQTFERFTTKDET